WSKLSLELAPFHEAVVGLERLVPRPFADVARPQRSCQTPGGIVRRPDVANFARAHQPLEGFHRLFDRHLLVIGMGLIEVDVISLETTKAVLDRSRDVR